MTHKSILKGNHAELTCINTKLETKKLRFYYHKIDNYEQFFPDLK